MNKENLKELGDWMIYLYDTQKYNEHYNLISVALSWDETDNTWNDSQTKVSSLGINIEVLLKKIKEEGNYKKPIVHFPAVLRKAHLATEGLANYFEIAKEIILANPEKKEELKDIILWKKIGTEAANTFIDMYDEYKIDEKYNLSDFLQRYDISQRQFIRKGAKQKGNYFTLFSFLNYMYKLDWSSAFIKLLPEEIGERIENICNTVGIDNKKKEEKIQFLEKLITEGALGYIESTDDVSYDILASMYGSQKFSEQKRTTFEELCKEKKENGLRIYLGYCRKRRRPDDTVTDWTEKFLEKVTENISESDYRIDQVLQARLRNATIQKYFSLFVTTHSLALLQIEKDGANAKITLERELLMQTKKHYEIVLACGNLDNVKRTILYRK